MNIQNIYKNKDKFAARQIENELVLVPIKNSVLDMNELFKINEVGNFIWNNIDKKNSVEDIAIKISEEYEIDYRTALDDTKEFLEKIDNLIRNINNEN